MLPTKSSLPTSLLLRAACSTDWGQVALGHESLIARTHSAERPGSSATTHDAYVPTA